MMRKFVLAMVLLAQFCFADVWQDAFERGNRFYRDGHFQEAVDAYSEALENGMESGELYFNLGNAYYKLNENGKSRLNYEKAAILLKNDEALLHNLDLVKMRLVDQIVIPPKFVLVQWWDMLLNIFSLNLLTWLVLGVFVLFLFSLGFMQYFRGRKRRPAFIYVYRFLMVSLILLIIILLNRVYIFETEEFAIILTPKVTAYASPDSRGTEVFILHEGTKVRLLRTDQDWFEVKIDDGKTGWLEQSHLEKI